MKVLILGHNGMLGHMVHKYFSKHTECVTLDVRWPSQEFKDAVKESDADLLINCIGAIPQRTKDFTVNTELPIWLDQNFNGNIIHPGTDCEMDDDEYGISKNDAAMWLKENTSRTKIIKTSIIGPELNGSASLLYWFLSNPDDSSTRGYTNHMWNGNTTYAWAEFALKMAKNFHDYKTETIIATKCRSKYDLLNIINDVYNREIVINAFETPTPALKCLTATIEMEDIDVQLTNMRKFYEN